MYEFLKQHETGNRPKISLLLKSNRPFAAGPCECRICGGIGGQLLVWLDTGEEIPGSDGEPWSAPCRPCSLRLERGEMPKTRRANPYLQVV